jgi:signal peptidase I
MQPCFEHDPARNSFTVVGLYQLVRMKICAEGTPPPSWLRRVLFGRDPKRTLVRVVILATVLPFTFTVVLRPVHVQGISMVPTYHDNRYNFVNRLAYLFHEPQRGDVVVATPYSDKKIMLLKRIIGMPGEIIAFHQGRAFINGQILEEPYMNFQQYPCDWEIAPMKIGSDEYYVVGDNRTMPEANHSKLIAPRSCIMGRILL